MSQSADLLALLSDGQPHEMRAIHRAIGFCRLNSRVSELRGRGYGIECDKTGGQYVYTLVSRPLAESDTETVGRYEGTFQCATNPEAWSGTTEASARRPEPIERPKNEASLHAYSVSDSASGATAGSSVQFLGCASGLNSPTDEPHGAVPLDLLTVEPDGQLALVAA